MRASLSRRARLNSDRETQDRQSSIPRFLNCYGEGLGDNRL